MSNSALGDCRSLDWRDLVQPIAYQLQRLVFNKVMKRHTGIRTSLVGKPKGRVLVSYLVPPLLGAERIPGHSNVWESAAVITLFNRLGYVVDAIPFNDTHFIPHARYKAIFDIHHNLQRYAKGQERLIFHVTGSHPAFSNRAEHGRIIALQERRGQQVRARRWISEQDIQTFDHNLSCAHVITLIGNETTRSSYPQDFHHKIKLIPATGSFLRTVRNVDLFAPAMREYLWFNGTGAVHKGLDLALDAFAANPQYRLHVVGPHRKEKDFFAAYRNELTRFPNIVEHGYKWPSSPAFHRILMNVVAFVSPSCSEGISTAAITCMHYGMIPVISPQCGITIDPDEGFELISCTSNEIVRAVEIITALPDSALKRMISSAQQLASEAYSRSNFYSVMEKILRNLLLAC